MHTWCMNVCGTSVRALIKSSSCSMPGPPVWQLCYSGGDMPSAYLTVFQADGELAHQILKAPMTAYKLNRGNLRTASSYSAYSPHTMMPSPLTMVSAILWCSLHWPWSLPYYDALSIDHGLCHTMMPSPLTMVSAILWCCMMLYDGPRPGCSLPYIPEDSVSIVQCTNVNLQLISCTGGIIQFYMCTNHCTHTLHVRERRV